MRTVQFPNLSGPIVLSDCISGVKDVALATRLKSIQPALDAWGKIYHAEASSSTLYNLPRMTELGSVTKKELESLYSEQMSAVNGAARRYYNALRNSTANSKCPLCGIGTVTVLDHHLPKSKYPYLAVFPPNLVPACDFCNNAKKAKYPKNAGQQTLHPYYDDFTSQQWIFGNLDTGGPPTLLFFVAPPAHWTPIDCQRVGRHFDAIKLGISYVSNANDDMILLREYLEKLSLRGGTKAVESYLLEERDKYSGRLNSWQHVMYQTLAGSPWFISGGFLNIPT